MSAPSENGSPTLISDEEFGARFVAAAVTPARIDAAVSRLVGHGIDMGTFAVGPGKVAKATVRGEVDAPIVAATASAVVFELRLPVRLDISIALSTRTLRLAATVDIDLTLRARTADPLLVVIDIAPVTRHDVSRPVIEVESADTEARTLVGPMAKLVRDDIPDRLNALLADPAARRARVFDIGAIVDGTPTEHHDLTAFDWIDDAEFGRRLLPRIVTTQQIAAVAAQLSGRVVTVGPEQVGPRGTARVSARGTVRMPRITRRTGADSVTFDLVVPVVLEVVVTGLGTNRYHAEVDIALELRARTAAPLLIVVEVDPPRSDQIAVQLRAEGMRARTLGTLGGVRRRIAEQASAAVSRHLADPAARVVDVEARISAHAPEAPVIARRG
ncbi:hypothetical protein ACFWUP_15235 [Nocardia sp. NPDC058658]|uniref:hypothetical protein n=1 Tax=Nocardia sp. NPDC058658 TaxID=3346580 RepID=UPI0036495D69